MTHHILLIIHLIAASIWVGGHLILLLVYIPKALKNNTLDGIVFFRKNFEAVGIPSLLILIITGILMAYDYDVTINRWFSFAGGIEKIVSIKLILVLITITLATTATQFIFPKLENMPTVTLVLFIVIVTLIAVAMLVLGSFVRLGGL